MHGSGVQYPEHIWLSDFSKERSEGAQEGSPFSAFLFRKLYKNVHRYNLGYNHCELSDRSFICCEKVTDTALIGCFLRQSTLCQLFACLLKSDNFVVVCFRFPAVFQRNLADQILIFFTLSQTFQNLQFRG